MLAVKHQRDIVLMMASHHLGVSASTPRRNYDSQESNAILLASTLQVLFQGVFRLGDFIVDLNNELTVSPFVASRDSVSIRRATFLVVQIQCRRDT